MNHSSHQDFTRIMKIVIRDDVASWQLTNTVGHIAAYLGNKMTTPFETGEYFEMSDGMTIPRNSQYPVVVLSASQNEIKKLFDFTKEYKGSMVTMIYTQDMIDHSDDNALADVLRHTPPHDLNILGIGFFGTKDELKPLTGKLSLWK